MATPRKKVSSKTYKATPVRGSGKNTGVSRGEINLFSATEFPNRSTKNKLAVHRGSEGPKRSTPNKSTAKSKSATARARVLRKKK